MPEKKPRQRRGHFDLMGCQAGKAPMRVTVRAGEVDPFIVHQLLQVPFMAPQTREDQAFAFATVVEQKALDFREDIAPSTLEKTLRSKLAYVCFPCAFPCAPFLSFRPPPLTPRRDRSVVPAATLVSSNPRSPVAMAARVISLEESARSTLRMKRAAEAIALEDAQTCVRM